MQTNNMSYTEIIDDFILHATFQKSPYKKVVY